MSSTNAKMGFVGHFNAPNLTDEQAQKWYSFYQKINLFLWGQNPSTRLPNSTSQNCLRKCHRPK